MIALMIITIINGRKQLWKQYMNLTKNIIYIFVYVCVFRWQILASCVHRLWLRLQRVFYNSSAARTLRILWAVRRHHRNTLRTRQIRYVSTNVEIVELINSVSVQN